MNEKDSINRIDAVDGLKGVCAFIVAFIWHYQHFSPSSSPFFSFLKPFYMYGDKAVEIFFMISGFGLLIGYENKIINRTVDAKSFWAKRIKTLFPLMILTTCITAILQVIYLYKAGTILQYPNETFNLYHFFLNLLGIQYGILGMDFSFNGPLWFIGVLFICYMAYFLIVYLIRDKEEILPCCYILLSLIGLLPIIKESVEPLNNFLVGRGISCFFIGCLLGKIYQNRDTLIQKRIGYVSLVLLMCCAVLTKIFGYDILYNTTLFIIVIWGPLLIISILFVPFFNKLLSLKPLKLLGDISIEIFMWHFPIQIIWKIIDVYGNLNIDFGRKRIFVLYIISVIFFSYIYKKRLRNKVNNLYKYFVKENTL